MFTIPTIRIRMFELVIPQVPPPDPFSSLLWPAPGQDFIYLAFFMVVFPLGLNSGRICIRKSRSCFSTSPLADVVFLQGRGSLGRNVLHSCPFTWLQKHNFFPCSLGYVVGMAFHQWLVSGCLTIPCLMPRTPYNSPFKKLFSCEFSGGKFSFLANLALYKETEKKLCCQVFIRYLNTGKLFLLI